MANHLNLKKTLFELDDQGNLTIFSGGKSVCVPLVEVWNEHAREALRLAEKEAISLKQNAIGCEHLLLGILGQEQSVAMKALQSFEIDLVKTREALEQKIGR
jgi:Clp amino terminal domain, pathogenicity island component